MSTAQPHGSTRSIAVSPPCRTPIRRFRLRCGRAPSFSSSPMPSSSTALTSRKEHPLEVHGDRPARGLCRADLVADYRGVVCYNRVAPDRGPFRLSEPGLAFRAVHVRRVRHCVIVDGARHRPLSFFMSYAYAKLERGKSADLREVSANQAQVEQAKASLVFAQQQAVRYGELAEKGYGPVQSAQQFSAEQREKQAAVESAQATLKLAERQVEALRVQRASAEASLAQAKAQREQAKVNLRRTQIRSPLNRWVTNLVTQLGDYTTVGQDKISVVDADSFWVDGYFTETALGSIREGDPAKVKLMGYNQIVRGHVGSIARGINVPNAQAGPKDLRP